MATIRSPAFWGTGSVYQEPTPFWAHIPDRYTFRQELPFALRPRHFGRRGGCRGTARAKALPPGDLLAIRRLPAYPPRPLPEPPAADHRRDSTCGRAAALLLRPGGLPGSRPSSPLAS